MDLSKVKMWHEGKNLYCSYDGEPISQDELAKRARGNRKTACSRYWRLIHRELPVDIYYIYSPVVRKKPKMPVRRVKKRDRFYLDLHRVLCLVTPKMRKKRG